MNDFFSKERRGEDGDVVQSVLIIAVFAIIVMVIGSMMYNAISSEAKQLSTSETPGNQNIDWITSTGKAIEEWIVANPQEGVPATKDYILYDDYKEDIAKNGKSFPSGTNTYVRVIPSENNDGSFTVCGYYSESDDAELHNMDIYGFNSTNGTAGKQTRGVCLL